VKHAREAAVLAPSRTRHAANQHALEVAARPLRAVA
jgi:hypothetical protein